MADPMNASTARSVRDPERQWIPATLRMHDPAVVEHYERTLYQSFFPILQRNPLIRDLWIWDDQQKRLRTQVPYEDQWVVALTHGIEQCYCISVGINLRVDRYWQSGSYEFPQPTPACSACEFLIMAHGDAPIQHGPTVIRKLVTEYLLPQLQQRGFEAAYATCADHLLRLYLRMGADKMDEREVNAYPRHLLRWVLRSESVS